MVVDLKGLTLKSILVGIIGIAIIFTALTEAMPTAQNAGNDLSENTTLPFRAFFAGGGLIFLAIMGGIVIVLVAGAVGGISKKNR